MPVLIYMFLHISLNCIYFVAFYHLYRVFNYHIGANENNHFFTHICVISICDPYFVFFHMRMRLTTVNPVIGLFLVNVDLLIFINNRWQ